MTSEDGTEERGRETERRDFDREGRKRGGGVDHGRRRREVEVMKGKEHMWSLGEEESK